MPEMNRLGTGTRLRFCGAPPRAWVDTIPRISSWPFTGAPHVRGVDVTPALRDGAEGRSTPTCVGRTPMSSHRVPPITEHPHVRGADFGEHGQGDIVYGAPPRAWGGLQDADRRRVVRRSTPTCVGRTMSSTEASTHSPEHPHVRGADLHRVGHAPPVHGAPPRAWGGPGRTGVAAQRRRSTPTCVGRTGWTPWPASCPAEHPHVRGADRSALDQARMYSGAPPRAWGGHGLGGPQVQRARSTPTCVGRTARRHLPAGRRPEHPHVRGADRDCAHRYGAATGAPPRAWGGRRGGVPGTLPGRSTPTCVGRTAAPAA